MATYNLTNADIIKGGHLMVFVDDDQSGVLKPIAFATSHSLNKTLNTQEISTKDHGDYSAVLPQNITWEITTENLYSLDSYQSLNAAFNEMQEVTVYFGESTYKQKNAVTGKLEVQGSIVGANPAQQNWDTSGFGESGKAYITSLQVTAGAGENATFSATFTGSGALISAAAPTGATGATGSQS